jgi:hypothetical protein
MVFIVLVYALWAEGGEAGWGAAEVGDVLGGVPGAGDGWGLNGFWHFFFKKIFWFFLWGILGGFRGEIFL